MTKETNAVELKDADLDQIHGGGVVFEVEVEAKDSKWAGAGTSDARDIGKNGEKGVLSSLQTG